MHNKYNAWATQGKTQTKARNQSLSTASQFVGTLKWTQWTNDWEWRLWESNNLYACQLTTCMQSTFWTLEPFRFLYFSLLMAIQSFETPDALTQMQTQVDTIDRRSGKSIWIVPAGCAFQVCVFCIQKASSLTSPKLHGFTSKMNSDEFWLSQAVYYKKSIIVWMFSSLSCFLQFRGAPASSSSLRCMSDLEGLGQLEKIRSKSVSRRRAGLAFLTHWCHNDTPVPSLIAFIKCFNIFFKNSKLHFEGPHRKQRYTNYQCQHLKCT